jgi:NAD(P)-dependent dehydrogenase (short-subunit alcohol dehydrogenase family)
LKLTGKIALVTGAGKGIGRAISQALAKEEAIVIVCDLDKDAAEETVRSVEVMGYLSLPLWMDVTSSDSIDKTIHDIIDRFGKIDILVNNAGVSTMTKVVDMTEEEWDFNMDVNAKGVFLCSRAVEKMMIKNDVGGKIVNISSMAGKKGAKFLAHYCASKHAVIGFTKSLALELAPYNINVNSVCPGYVNTSMQHRELVWEAELEGTTPEEIKANYIALTPLGRLEEPEDVAKVVVFLCSDESNFITGQAINVTGGAEMQ